MNIICRDCNLSSQSIYHVIGLKCNHCCGYNTVRADDKLFVRVNSERKYFMKNSGLLSSNLISNFSFGNELIQLHVIIRKRFMIMT